MWIHDSQEFSHSNVAPPKLAAELFLYVGCSLRIFHDIFLGGGSPLIMMDSPISASSGQAVWIIDIPYIQP